MSALESSVDRMVGDPSIFVPWPKIPRLAREVLVSEKLDGTNAAILITDDGQVLAQSRKRMITPDDDNHGFARWVYSHDVDLAEQLGPGRHFGEWWGSGIQRGYGLTKGEKRFSLFNAIRWEAYWEDDYRAVEAPLCHVVPILSRSSGFGSVEHDVDLLRKEGSIAAPGFMNPEGIVAFHVAGHTSFKVTLERDEEWKGKTLHGTD